MSHRKTTASTVDSRFADSEYLRGVLIHLHNEGTDSWRTNPVANDLLEYLIDRFATLARKYGLEPDDGGSAAWEAIRQPSICTANDPWGQIVNSVQTTIRANHFANNALCSEQTARAGGLENFWAERFSDRETPVWQYHRAFVSEDYRDDPNAGIHYRAADIAAMFIDLGWPQSTYQAIAVVLHKLADTGSRASAYEALRRDYHMQVLVELPRRAWTTLLRLLLGNPRDRHDVTDRGKGILLRLALGEAMLDLDGDTDLLNEILDYAPQTEPNQPASEPTEPASSEPPGAATEPVAGGGGGWRPTSSDASDADVDEAEEMAA